MWDKQINSLIILECAVILRYPLYGNTKTEMLNLVMIFFHWESVKKVKMSHQATVTRLCLLQARK